MSSSRNQEYFSDSSSLLAGGPEAFHITSPLTRERTVHSLTDCFISLSCYMRLFSWGRGGGVVFDFLKDFIVFIAAFSMFHTVSGGRGFLLESLYHCFSGFICC